MKLSLINNLFYIIILLFASMAYSDINKLKDCSASFSKKSKNKRIETLKKTMLEFIEHAARHFHLSQNTRILAHNALKDFIDFLDPETLNLKNMTSEEISQYNFAHLRQPFLELETLESKLLKKIDPQTFIKEFLYIHYYKKNKLPEHLIRFFQLYVNSLSFRRDIYKMELFMMLFKDIFPTLSIQQILVLLPLSEREFFKKHIRKLFHNDSIDDPKDMKEWRIRLHEFIEHYDEIKPNLVK